MSLVEIPVTIRFFNILNLVLLACFFEVLFFPLLTFRSTYSVWVQEVDFTYEFNRYTKTRNILNMYVRTTEGKRYVLMSRNMPDSSLNKKPPFLLYISEEKIFRLPARGKTEWFGQSLMFRDYIPALFLSCFGILITSIIFFYHKNLTRQIIILFILNVAILGYLMYYSRTL